MMFNRVMAFAWSALAVVAFIATLVGDSDWEFGPLALVISLLYSIRADMQERASS